MRDEGAYEQAVGLFETLLTEETDGQTARGGLHSAGPHLHFCLDLPAKGESYFRTATELVPSYDVASLGLFHSLHDQGRDAEALDEMKRYTSQYSSDEYAQLARDMKVSFKWFN